MQLIYLIITEINGYKNVYGHLVYGCREDAEKAAETVRSFKVYDSVFVCSYALA